VVLRVFILAGQSNMEGKGKIRDSDPKVKGTLEVLVDKEPNSPFSRWRQPDGNWATRDDVYIVGPAPVSSWEDFGSFKLLTPGYGASSRDTIGPELSIGQVLGDHYRDPVMLVKVAVGGKNLRHDFRPPSAGGTTGSMYTAMVREVSTLVSSSLQQLAALPQPAILSGFFWWQGWNDLASPEGYGKLLQALIADLRADLKVPSLPVVVADTGHGYEPKRSILVAEQKEATDASPPSAFVPTGSYLRDASESPNDALHHFHDNAGSFMRIGLDMGNAMLPML